MLLSDEKVSQFLEERFVLAWETVRPAPKVTVDYGDGRTLTRTIRGNTVLYLCTPEGRVVDAYPGLYRPEDFLAQIEPALERMSDPEKALAWHREEAALAEPPGDRAATTVSKMVVELPLARELSRPGPRSQRAARDAFERWTERLEDASEGPQPPESLEALAGADAVAEDSARSVRYLRPAVHLWFATRDTLPEPSECRNPLFKQLLKVPLDDPWLGLRGEPVPGTE